MAWRGVASFCWYALLVARYFHAYRRRIKRSGLVNRREDDSQNFLFMLKDQNKKPAEPSHDIDCSVDKRHWCLTENDSQNYLATSFAFWFGKLKTLPQQLDLFELGETTVQTTQNLTDLKGNCAFFKMCYDGKLKGGRTTASIIDLDRCFDELAIQKKCITQYEDVHSDARTCEQTRRDFEDSEKAVEKKKTEIQDRETDLQEAKKTCEDARTAYHVAKVAAGIMTDVDLARGNTHSFQNSIGAGMFHDGGCERAECLTCKYEQKYCPSGPYRRRGNSGMRRRNRRRCTISERLHYCCSSDNILTNLLPHANLQCVWANGFNVPSAYVQYDCTCIHRCAASKACERKLAANINYENLEKKEPTLDQMRNDLVLLEKKNNIARSKWDSTKAQCEKVFEVRFLAVAACAVENYNISCEKRCIDEGASKGAGIVEGNTPDGVLKPFLKPLPSWSNLSWIAFPIRPNGSAVDGDAPPELSAHWESKQPQYVQKASIQHEMTWNERKERCVVLEFGDLVRSARLIIFPRDACKSNASSSTPPIKELMVWTTWSLTSFNSENYGDVCFKLWFTIPRDDKGGVETGHSFCLLDSTKRERDIWMSHLKKAQVTDGTRPWYYDGKNNTNQAGKTVGGLFR
eukprot:TRINITY_DN14143_c0_g1_i3.p1 TRINITY_DN14143_c0_g1~~TRINITY_DN14143_c0_g1_i3.p1  ORF type:complete len:631 (-),score=64.08 TRINITY_DN14143_c0_g1_i3:165-2057(-)